MDTERRQWSEILNASTPAPLYKHLLRRLAKATQFFMDSVT